MLNGTSMASPQAAGAAALLVSAAKQAGVQQQPDQIRAGAELVERALPRPAATGAYEQGNGLIDVGAAWNLLKTNIKTVDITSSVPVNTVLSAASSRRPASAGHLRPRGRHGRRQLHARRTPSPAPRAAAAPRPTT